jgi:hypothetical protein
MTTDRTADGALSPELEAIADAEPDGELHPTDELGPFHHYIRLDSIGAPNAASGPRAARRRPPGGSCGR